MKKLLIGLCMMSLVAIIIQLLDRHTTETERADEIRCPYLIERDIGGKHHAVYYSS